ncbi:MAG: hypothetical protein Q4G46_00020, partial [Propionibacteriaceae bacterium]|nr:hypothetical protein [Propionibacteriaceae bacterium]
SLGRFLSPVLGSPAALLGAYLILALPSSLSPFALRHIVGFHLDCCFLSSEPALPAVVAPILWWSLITAAVLAVLCLPDHSRFTRTLPAIAAVGAMATGGLILSPVVAHLESFPQQPRAAALLSCRPTSLGASGPEVCLWPESEALRPGAAVAFAIVTQQLRCVGVNPPPVASEGVGASWLISAHSQPELMLWNATLGLVLREAPRCSQTQEWRMGEQAEILAAWVGLTIGLEDERLQTNFQSDILLDAQDQRRRPIAEQSAWFTENLRRLDQSVATDDCTIGPAA